MAGRFILIWARAPTGYGGDRVLRLTGRVREGLTLAITASILLPLVMGMTGCGPGKVPTPALRKHPSRAMITTSVYRTSFASTTQQENSLKPGSRTQPRPVLTRQFHPVDPEPDELIVVSMAVPEMMTLWRQGQVAFQTYCNTGVPGAGTPPGRYRIKRKIAIADMRGHELNGRPYNDPAVPWVMYFHRGDALHGFVRPGYGWPQSLGCVELSIPAAAELYQQVYVGTRVIVLGPDGRS